MRQSKKHEGANLKTAASANRSAGAWRRFGAAAAAGVLAMCVSGCGGDQAADHERSLTYWVRLHPNIGTSVTNYGETPFAKEYAARTGVRVSYLHPAQGQEKESLNLLIASGELPDIIETDWLERNPEASIEKNTIIELNELIENDAPSLKKFLAENPRINKEVKTDGGSYYVFPFVRNGEKLLSTAGFMLRGDWLEELGLEPPETVAEWESVLTAFKEKKGAACPFAGGSWQLRYFAGGFDVGYDFYIDGGRIKYGCIEPRFGEYLETMHRWYKNGLIDKNFALMDDDYITANMLSGAGGAALGAGGSTLGVWSNSAKNNGDTAFLLKPVKFPARQKGQKAEFGKKEWPYSPLNGAAITGQCRDPKLAAKFLDYSYSEEGSMLNNFGIEGESYQMIDGSPRYTELITDNPDNLPMAQVLTMYVRASTEGPFVQDERYIEQYYQLENQKEALELWADNKHELHAIPQITLNKNELTEYNRIMTDFVTFRDENVVSFIIGSRPIEEFPAFVQECKNRNVERAIEIYQAAYERFMSR